MYEVFEHTADIGLRICAATRPELLQESARGFFSLLVEDLDTIRPQQHRGIRLEGDDDAYLLFDWLNELLFLFETEHFLVSCATVKLSGDRLEATVSGEPVDRSRHRLGQEIKAVTYHQLEMKETADGWEATVILDI